MKVELKIIDSDLPAWQIAQELQSGDMDIFLLGTWMSPRHVEARQRLRRAGLIAQDPILSRKHGWLQCYRTDLGKRLVRYRGRTPTWSREAATVVVLVKLLDVARENRAQILDGNGEVLFDPA